MKKFPYTAYRLTTGFHLKPATLVAPAYGEWEVADNGARHRMAEVYATPREAVIAGNARLMAQQARLDKMQAALHKRLRALGNMQNLVTGGNA